MIAPSPLDTDCMISVPLHETYSITEAATMAGVSRIEILRQAASERITLWGSQQPNNNDLYRVPVDEARRIFAMLPQDDFFDNQNNYMIVHYRIDPTGYHSV